MAYKTVPKDIQEAILKLMDYFESDIGTEIQIHEEYITVEQRSYTDSMKENECILNFKNYIRTYDDDDNEIIQEECE